MIINGHKIFGGGGCVGGGGGGGVCCCSELGKFVILQIELDEAWVRTLCGVRG